MAKRRIGSFFHTTGPPLIIAFIVAVTLMIVSHANDSYFWVATNFGKITPQQGYKTQTILTLVMGIASIIDIFVLSLFF